MFGSAVSLISDPVRRGVRRARNLVRESRTLIGGVQAYRSSG